MKTSKSKMIMGAAALGAAMGVAMMAGKIRENNKSTFEKFIDDIAERLK
jgi:hypothetical protein